MCIRDSSWRQVCDEELRAGDNVSLLAGVSWSAALRLTRHGVATRSDLAGLDWLTADIACGDSSSSPRVDLEEVLAHCEGLPPSRGLGDALGRNRRTRLTRLASRGITTVGDLDLLDRRTVAVTGLRVGFLPGLCLLYTSERGVGPHRSLLDHRVLPPRGQRHGPGKQQRHG